MEPPVGKRTKPMLRYTSGYPLWVFLEAIEFGRFCGLWLFCANRWDGRSMLDMHYMLKGVKSLRNATCHNGCIINGFSASANKASFSGVRAVG